MRSSRRRREEPKRIAAVDYFVVFLGFALTYEQLNNLPEATSYREKIAELDPWNAKNYLALGKYYKQQGDLGKSNVMLEKILSFAVTNQIADQAKIELAN